MNNDRILKAYEQLAGSYNENIDHKPHNAYYDRPHTLELLGEVAGLKILDAGCGPGKYAEILINQGADVTGFDFSPKMIKLARERNQEKGTFFVHDLNEPLFHLRNESFDATICTLALNYIEDWTPVIKEFHRVLKPSGILVISMEHPYFQFTYHQSEDYFATEQVSAIWSGFGTPVTVHNYRRSLQDSINPILQNGFQLLKLKEPKPTPEFEKLDPKHYRELMLFPSFMHVKAQRM